MRLRLVGRPAEVDAAVEELRDVFAVHTSSRPYATRAHSRDAEVRVYLTVSLPPGRPPVDPTAPRCPWCRLPNVVDAQGDVPDGRAWSCRRCGRTYAMTRGLVIEAVTVDGGLTQPGDWVRVPGGWLPWSGQPITRRHEVLRPLNGIAWDGETPLGGAR